MPNQSRTTLLIEDAPQDGATNMAIDESLLDAAVSSGQAALRVYRWSEPTLSRGYFQRELPANLPERLRSLPQVRRLTGGGAILHDHEWTYSCALPAGHPLARRTEALYDAIHADLIAAFAELEITLTRRGISNRQVAEPFLCFLRASEHDLLAAGHKVVGSAQRRRKGAVLQHGSVILSRSELAPEVPGLRELVDMPFANRLADPLAGADCFARLAGRHILGTPTAE